MKIFNHIVVLRFVPLIMLVGCSEEKLSEVPRAQLHPEKFHYRGISWNDPYSYMLDLKHPDTLQYVADEQRYFFEQTLAWESKLAEIISELNDQLSTERKTVPIVVGDFEYHSKVSTGTQYPVYYRRPKGSNQDFQIVLDLNELSSGTDYYSLGGFSISGDQRTVAYTEDLTGDGSYFLRTRDIGVGTITTLALHVSETVSWNGDSVLGVDKSTNSVFQYRPDGEKLLLYEELDRAFSLKLRTARDRKTVIITAESHRATEIRILPLGGRLRLVSPREDGHRYRVMVEDDQTTVLSNYKRDGYSLALISDAGDDPDDWNFYDLEVSGSVVDFESFGRHLLVQVRNRLKDELVVLDLRTGDQRRILTGDKGESFRLMQGSRGVNPGFRFIKESPIKPARRFGLREDNQQAYKIDSDQAPKSYNAELYQIEERWLIARDEVEVPVTLIYKKGGSLAKRPLYLTAYGAYGISLPRTFDSTRLPLLDRGFILGIAHVRGGGDLGDAWHASGRHLYKKNTFNDLVDVAYRLIEGGIGHPEMLAARGASAGGTIAGVVANENPKLFKVIVASEPFVDVFTTLLNPELPLTKSDILEWGDPSNAVDAKYLFAFSPYQQVREQAYPSLLVQTSINDGRVGMHESLKWMAKIRENARGSSLQLIDIKENSGHLGASDQYLKRRKQAFEYLFVMRALGLKE